MISLPMASTSGKAFDVADMVFLVLITRNNPEYDINEESTYKFHACVMEK